MNITLFLSRIILTFAILYGLKLVWTKDVNLILWSKQKIASILPINKSALESLNANDTKQMADQIVSWEDHYGGSRVNYEKLRFLGDTTKDPLIVEKLKIIESIFRSDTMTYTLDRQSAIWKLGADPNNPEWEPIEGYDAVNVFQHLNRDLWTERARAACLLRKIKNAKRKDEINKEEFYNKLLDLIRKDNEPSLAVSKMALNTYSSLSGFIPSEIFDFDGAIKHWKNHKENILKKNF